MNKLTEVRDELQGFNNAFANLQKEKVEMTKELEQKKQERQKVLMEQWGTNIDGRTTKPLNQKVEQLEKELAGVEEQLELAEQVKAEKFLPRIDELIAERAEVAEASNKKILELEEQLFKAKLEFMLELERAAQEQLELQSNIDEYHSIISLFESDRKEELSQIKIYSPDYLTLDVKAPVAPTNKELHKLVHKENSPHRLPYSFLVYKMSGEVFVQESEAYDRFHELQKGAK